MIELGGLDRQHADFARRNVRVIAISNDNLDDAQKTQAKFPNLVIVADPMLDITDAMQVRHAGAAMGGGDTNAPTTFLIDGAGTVRWLYRPDRFTTRLSPSSLLAAIDETWPDN